MDILKVFGPPGTGKTWTLLQIMEEELGRGVAPERLAYLSFTKQARREAMTRAMEKFSLTEEELPNFRTLHAICYRELNMTVGGMVKGTNDLRELGERLGLGFTYRARHADDVMLDMPSGGEVGDRLLQFDHVRRHNMLSVDVAWSGVFDDDITIYQARRFVQAYTDWKQGEGLRDFTDLLEEAQEPLEVDVVIVDEAQDLSRLQWAALHRIAKEAKRLYIAGDDDQAIFTWAGADPVAFIEHPGRVRVLAQSYRVPGAVHQLASALADRITYRQPKRWAPRATAGTLQYAADLGNIALDPAAQYLFLYRHHYQVADVEELVRTAGLPYTRGDRPAPGAEWGHAILFWERLRRGEQLTHQQLRMILDAMAKDTVISEGARKQLLSESKKTLFTKASLKPVWPELPLDKPWFEALTRISLEDIQYLRSIVAKQGAKALTEKPKIRLSTIHAAKGAEADNVILITEMSNRTREIYEQDPDIERRVFYVGVTRAKERLTIISGGNNPLFP